jgi:dolichol kinase
MLRIFGSYIAIPSYILFVNILLIFYNYIRQYVAHIWQLYCHSFIHLFVNILLIFYNYIRQYVAHIISNFIFFLLGVINRLWFFCIYNINAAFRSKFREYGAWQEISN